MLSMSDGELTNLLLTIIGGGAMLWLKRFGDWCKKTDTKIESHDSKLENHECRLVGLEAHRHE